MKGALIIFRKEFEEIRRIRSVYLTIFLVPLGLMTASATIFNFAIMEGSFQRINVEALRRFVPDSGGMPPSELALTFLANQFLIYYLLIPVAVSNIVASYSIIGEKLQRTLEPILATPIDDEEILMGKALAGIVPGLATTYGSFLLYTVVVDYLAYPFTGTLILPNVVWILAMLVHAPLLSFLSVMLLVLISSRVSDIRAAQQIGVVIVLPLIGLFVAQVAGVLVLGLLVFALLGVILAGVDVIIFRVSRRVFDRENILTKWK